MRWAKPGLKNSFFGWLGQNQAPIDRDQRLRDIREVMLGCLHRHGGKEHPALERRLRYSADIQALWYARSELMQVVSARLGESAAREQIASITALFEGVQPGGSTSRPSPLSE